MSERVPRNWRLAYIVCRPEHRTLERDYQMAKRIRFLAQQDEFRRSNSRPSNVVLTEEIIAKFGAEAAAWVAE